MNELLAQIYGTSRTEEAPEIEKTAEAALLEELEKVAAEEGIDLNELSDDDIIEILSEATGNDQTEKTASEDVPEEAQEKLAEADFLGRTMAHAFYQELNNIGDNVEKTAAHTSEEEKMAYDQNFEDAAMAQAEEILAAASEAVDGTEKTASDGEAVLARALEILDYNDYDVEKIASVLTDGTEKTASDFEEVAMAHAEEILAAAVEAVEGTEKTAGEVDPVTARALEILDYNDYDVEKIAQILS